MFTEAYTEGKGFSIIIDFPYRRFVLTTEEGSLRINTSYNELKELQNLISERLADFRTLQEKAKSVKSSAGGKK